MKVQVEGNEIHIILPISKQSSKSGKSIIVASTHGSRRTEAEIDGKSVTVNVNAYISKG